MSEITNISKILGDHNIILQNITANDINIVTGKEESPEVTAKKNEIAAEIAELIKHLDNYKQADKSPVIDASEDDFDEIDFDELIKAIEYENCVIFIGPEISRNNDNESIHEKFYREISSKKTKYDTAEGFFMPGSERKLKTKMMSFYREDFHKQNQKGYSLLEKIAQIPFNLIIISAPDDGYHRILAAHNKKHQFLFFDETEQQCEEPQKENPIVFNFLGNPCESGKFIFTHQQLHDYINQKQSVKVPTEIEAKVMDSEHFLFLGFDFERWQNRLALLSFNLEEEGYVFSEKKWSENTVDFLEMQFKISQINKNYDDFVDVLLQKANEVQLTKPLPEIFFENTLLVLERIRARTMDSEKLEPLMDISKELSRLKAKFF